MTVVPYERPQAREYVRRDWMEVMAPAVELARSVAETDFVPKAMRGNAAAICAAILYGDEVGLGPMQALSKIAVIDGRPTLAAEAQRALILAAGHSLWIEESTITRVTVAGRRADSEQTSRVTWTIEDAKRANLVGKTNWRTYPRQMLLARASAELARAIFADVIGGLAATEELEDVVTLAADVEQSGQAPAPTTTTRRRRRSAAPRVEAAPEPQPARPDRPPLPGEEPTETEQALAEQTEDLAEPVTPGRKRTLNALVGSLRKDNVITTEDVWRRVAAMRAIDADLLADLLNGRDEEGVLHWAPLRDSLDLREADELIERLKRKKADVAAAPQHERASLGVLAHLTALFHDRGYTDHAARVAYMSEQLGREVTPENDLTPAEADVLLTALSSPEPAAPVQPSLDDAPRASTDEPRSSTADDDDIPF